MASVRITENLRNEINARLVAPYNERIDGINNEIEALVECDEFADLIQHECVPADARDALNVLIDKCPGVLGIKSSLPVNIDMPDPSALPEGLWYVSLSKNVRIPAAVRSFKILPEHGEVHEKVRDLNLSVQRITAQRDEVEKTLIGEVLEKCSTLRQVISNWPSVVEYLPEEVLKKHNASPARASRSEDPEIEIPDSVKASLTAMKLT